MHKLKLVITLLLVSACTFGGGTAAQQSNEGNVRVRIVAPGGGGILGVAIVGVDLGSYEYSLDDQYAASGSISIHAWDLRGTGSGWRVTVAGTDFLDLSGTGESFSISNLSLTAGTIEANPANGHPTNAVPLSFAVAPVGQTQSTALLAVPETGAGSYVNTRQTGLLIPGGTLIGDYQSTLTVTISGTAP